MSAPLIADLEAQVATMNPTSQAERARLWMELANLELGPEAIELICAHMEGMVETSGYPAGRAWGKLVQGWSRLKLGANEEARDLFTQAAELFEEYGDVKGTARCLNAMAVVELYLNLYDKALETLEKARALAESLDWDELVGSINSNMGLVHLELGDFAEAAKRLEMARGSGSVNFNNRVVIDCHLATAYAELGRQREAEALLRSALEFCKRDRLRVTEIDVLARYGRLLQGMGRTDEAGAAFAQALSGAREIGNKRLISETGIELGKLLTKTGEPDRGVEALSEAESAAEGSRLNALKAKALAAIAQARAVQGLWHEAYDASRESARIEAEVFTENVAGQASIARAERMAAETAAYRAQMRRLGLIADIGRAVAGAMDAASVGKVLYDHLAGLVPVSAFGLALNHEESRQLEYIYCMVDGTSVDPFSIPLDADDSIAAWCAREGRDLIVSDLQADYPKYIRAPRIVGPKDIEPMRSLMACPVRYKDSIMAIVTAQSGRVGAYEPHHMEILRAVCAYVGVALENARLFAEVLAVAGTDPLTGVLNRRRFLEFFARELDHAKRYGGELGFIIFDLDRFKDVNDTWGHAAGDAVLKRAAASAGRTLRTTDFIARYGGEEFVILLPSTGLEGSALVAERIRTAFAEAAVDGGDAGAIPFTASFGVAAWVPEDDFDSLSGRADQALYAAKGGGRNRVETTGGPESHLTGRPSTRG